MLQSVEAGIETGDDIELHSSQLGAWHVIQSSDRLLLYLRPPDLGSEINDPWSNLSSIKQHALYIPFEANARKKLRLFGSNVSN